MDLAVPYFQAKPSEKVLQSLCQDAYELTRILSANKTYAEDFDPKADVSAASVENSCERMIRNFRLEVAGGYLWHHLETHMQDTP